MYKSKRLRFIGNPQLIQINEIILGISNYELIDEILSNSLKSSKTSNVDLILDSILKQRSFMPILPLKKEDDSTSINVDYRKMSNLFFSTVPDIFITPFKNIPLGKKSNNSLFVNPSSLITHSKTKGDILGSYLSMWIYPVNTLSGSNILNRIRVDKINIEEK